MPGGKNNIKPEDGKQFSSEYQPKEKWTEEEAKKLGNELINWIKEDSKDNMFFEEFLIIKKELYLDVIAYLSKKFSSFSELIQTAKKIQEIKLVKYGVKDKLNASMAKFVLTNNHDFVERKEVIEPKDKVIKVNIIDK